MYKKELLFQKIVCIVMILASALVFIYALGFMTDLYDCFYYTMRNPDNLLETKVPGSIIYYDAQSFNSTLLKLSIGLILVSCLLFITNTNVRRKYYIGNYVAIGLSVVANFGVFFWAHSWIEYFKGRFLTTVDFEALEKYAENRSNVLYTRSTFWFDIHWLVFGILICATVLLVVNMVWKLKLMKEEKALIEEGKGAKA